MKLTKQQLHQIIREELSVLLEVNPFASDGTGLPRHRKRDELRRMAAGTRGRTSDARFEEWLGALMDNYVREEVFGGHPLGDEYIGLTPQAVKDVIALYRGEEVAGFTADDQSRADLAVTALREVFDEDGEPTDEQVDQLGDFINEKYFARTDYFQEGAGDTPYEHPRTPGDDPEPYSEEWLTIRKERECLEAGGTWDRTSQQCKEKAQPKAPKPKWEGPYGSGEHNDWMYNRPWLEEGNMKITKQQLNQIIKEELIGVLTEITGFEPTSEMEVMKHYQELLDALGDMGRSEWVDVLARLRPELERDLDVEAQDAERAEKEYEEDVFTNAPRDYTSMQEVRFTKQQLKQIIREELSRILKDQYRTEVLPNGLLRVRDRRSGLVGLFNRDLTKHSGDLKIAKGKLKQILGRETAY